MWGHDVHATYFVDSQIFQFLSSDFSIALYGFNMDDLHSQYPSLVSHIWDTNIASQTYVLFMIIFFIPEVNISQQ
mgnify:CR=1 FL=1